MQGANLGRYQVPPRITAHADAEPPDIDGPSPEAESFTDCLNRHWRRSGMSLSQLARASWLNISYVSRLTHLPCDPLNPRLADRRETRHPSRDTVIRLGLAMQLPIEGMDELLMAAGFAPLVR
jgi:hypothetical protein